MKVIKIGIVYLSSGLINYHFSQLYFDAEGQSSIYFRVWQNCVLTEKEEIKENDGKCKKHESVSVICESPAFAKLINRFLILYFQLRNRS